MSDLKTLKDMEFYRFPNSSRGISVDVEKLKLEAIKWIRIIERKIKMIEDLESKPQSILQCISTKGLDEVLLAQKRIFMDFFNITEEDLK